MDDTAPVEYISPSTLSNVTWLGLGCFGLLAALAVVGFVLFLITKSKR